MIRVSGRSCLACRLAASAARQTREASNSRSVANDRSQPDQNFYRRHRAQGIENHSKWLKSRPLVMKVYGEEEKSLLEKYSASYNDDFLRAVSIIQDEMIGRSDEQLEEEQERLLHEEDFHVSVDEWNDSVRPEREAYFEALRNIAPDRTFQDALEQRAASEAAQLVQAKKNIIQNVITEDNLDQKIAEALSETRSFNFALDSSGQIHEGDMPDMGFPELESMSAAASGLELTEEDLQGVTITLEPPPEDDASVVDIFGDSESSQGSPAANAGEKTVDLSDEQLSLVGDLFSAPTTDSDANTTPAATETGGQTDQTPENKK